MALYYPLASTFLFFSRTEKVNCRKSLRVRGRGDFYVKEIGLLIKDLVPEYIFRTWLIIIHFYPQEGAILSSRFFPLFLSSFFLASTVNRGTQIISR